MHVRDAMSPEVTTVDAGAPLEFVADLMRACGTDALVVTEEGGFRGVVRASDVLLRLAAPPAASGPDSTQVVRSLPTHAGASIGSDARLGDAGRAMARLHVDVLAVLDGEKEVVGLLRISDLAATRRPSLAAAWAAVATGAVRVARDAVGRLERNRAGRQATG